MPKAILLLHRIGRQLEELGEVPAANRKILDRTLIKGRAIRNVRFIYDLAFSWTLT